MVLLFTKVGSVDEPLSNPRVTFAPAVTNGFRPVVEPDPDQAGISRH